MSCKDCDEIQDNMFDGKPYKIAFLRVEKANVAVIGCDKHIKILLEQLRSAEKEKK